MPTVLPAAQPHLTLANPLAPAYSTYSRLKGGSIGLSTSCRANDCSRNTEKWSLPFQFGLSTPPEDMTGVAVKPSLPSSSSSSSSYGAQSYGIQSSYSNARADKPVVHLVTEGMAQHNSVSTRIQQPPSLTSQLPDTHEKESSGSSIATYLQIPPSINSSKGSLAEFAAQITCLFWFEKASKLNVVLNPSSSKYHIPPLMPESIPTIGFRKWVTTILSTTQVSQNVILLALLFIYRLKKFNPAVRGKRGSEFRLMTIALMMGNKFLDDNTYTNKTWAEVSGISVQEIHIMEVEFLSNVRYNLFVTKQEWDQWHTKLGIFSDYFSKASRLPPDNEAQPATPTMQPSPHLTPTTPTSATLPPVQAPKLPSPPVPASYARLHHQNYPSTSAVIHGQPSLSPRQSSRVVNSNLGPSRKRSWDGRAEEHPAKKMARSTMSGPAPLPSLPPITAATASYIPPMTVPSVPQLSMPMVPSSVPQLPRLNFALAPNLTGPTYVPPQTQPQLPSSSRAMSSVYPPASTWSQQAPAATTLAPIPPALPSNSVNYADQSRRQSPYAPTSTTISPALSAYSVHTPTRLSPSFILDRNSPYRPVRQVNTLLYPPPSTSMDHTRPLPLEQMHYQPLGKAVSERKTGVLPYYHQETWGEPQPHVPSNYPSQQQQQVYRNPPFL
ncbi:hypothetical protein AJ79_00989 [Helicocarpus griseus UAMH5409]|uniref:Cyclin N-terminal domain-containing protein n=1 Tax=Helicocarpus griseus UAMH5409 TaxID=1447875 RepID=A0A2B7Y9N2_9EURO|nr:hypothetical protein AJ79_00989 [Helicocarpus griseus UAMH5409]